MSPLGIVLSALTISVLLIGAESAQVLLKLPLDLTRFFMGFLLLTVLLAETLVRYRLEFRRAPA